MPKSIYGREKADCEFNMTPMIDVTFQLIIFFILAGSFASMDMAKLTVASVWHDERIVDLKLKSKAVINIAPYTKEEIDAKPSRKGKAAIWQIVTKKWGPKDQKTGELVKLLKGLRREYEKRREETPVLKDTPYEVVLRADASLHSSEVHKVLRALSHAGFKKIHHVVLSTDDEK